ncbi:hypothetical protein P170DRAFT_335673, partial [Aspergillus steynii IBT 23096]
YQRTYKACVPCRRRKVKCQPGDQAHQPCCRCAKFELECRFDDRTPWAREGGGLNRMVSSSNDALGILFRAAAGEAGSATIGHGDTRHPATQGIHMAFSRPHCLPHADVLRVWDACRFVKMGWFSAFEAFTLVDLCV